MMAATLEALLEARTRRPAAAIPLAEPVPLDTVPTPALVVDVGALERNLDRMAGFLAARGVGLRPHAKMHKCPEVAGASSNGAPWASAAPSSPRRR
jgi:hypothetical protein